MDSAPLFIKTCSIQALSSSQSMVLGKEFFLWNSPCALSLLLSLSFSTTPLSVIRAPSPLQHQVIRNAKVKAYPNLKDHFNKIPGDF